MTKCIHCGLTLADPPNGEEGCGAPQIDTSPEGRSSAYKDFSRPVPRLTQTTVTVPSPGSAVTPPPQPNDTTPPYRAEVIDNAVLALATGIRL